MILRKSIGKIKRWFLPVLLLLFLVAATGFWLWIPSFLITRLSSYTHIKSEGKYVLSVNDMRRSLFPFSLRLSGVKLEPVNTGESGGENMHHEILYSFGAEDIQMEGINLRLLLFKNILSGNKIKVTRPEVKMEGEELLQVDSLAISSEFAKNMWPLFGHLQKIDIKKIELEEANFGFYSAAGDSNFISKAEKVSVDVHGFTADAKMANNNGQFFKTDDIVVRMNDFRNDMDDSLHVLTIDTLFYSLKTTDIRVKGFNLMPYSLRPDKNLFEVHVPEVYVKSRSIAHFALSDSLKIGFLEFSEPGIKFYHKSQSRQISIEDIDQFDLYSLVKNQFIKMTVDSFFLQGARVEIFRQPDTDNYRQLFQSIDIVLNGFELDSTSYLNRNKLLHASDLEMQVKGYHLILEDNEHHFRAGSLFASTYSNQLSAGDIEINPLNSQNINSRNEINIKCDALIIENVDFLDLYHRRIMPTSNIDVVKPIVHLQYNLEQEKQKKKEDSGLLFDLVTDYLLGVYAGSVSVSKGRLDIQTSSNDILKGYFETNIDFSLSEFRLDSASVQQGGNFFYASGFDLLFTDYNMRLTDDFHKLEVDTVSISSQNDQVQISNLMIRPVMDNVGMNEMLGSGHSELFKIFVPQISLKNVNLENAFFNQKINIADFNISNPEIYFENYGALREDNDKQELQDIYQLIFSYIEDIDISRFKISGGLLTWINHTRKGRTTTFDNVFSISLQNFRLNEAERSKKRLLFSDNFDLVIKDQEFQLSDNVHVLKGSEIRFSSLESKINVKNALLFPLITSEKYPDLTTTWQVTIPEIKIEGFDFHKAFYSQEPEIKTLEIVQPRVQIYSKPGKTKGLDFKAYNIPMPSVIESFKITELKVSNGEAITYSQKGVQHIAMANFFFNLSVPDFLLNNNEQNHIQVTSSNINLAVSDFKIPVDDIHNLHIEAINFNREKELIDISNLKLMPFMPNDSRNRFAINVPAIRFREFDFDAALEENNFIFTTIEANNPEISITINKEAENDSPEFLQTLDFYPYVEHLVNSVQVGILNINNAYLDLNWLQKEVFNNKLNLSFKEILLGSNQPSLNLLNSDSFTISTTGLTKRSKNQMYDYTVDSITYTSDGNKVSLKNIAIAPLSEKRSFPKQNGFQKEVVEAQIEYLEFRGIDEKRWLRENILDARAMVIGPAAIDIFRNKRFPFNEKQRPEWPQNLIKNLNQPFVIDSVKLMPSKIKYSELLAIFNEPGFIEFTELTFAGGRLTNFEEDTGKHNFFHLNAKARLQDEALLTASFIFDLNSPDFKHTVTGSLNPMSLPVLNPMIMKSAPLAIENGRITRLDFDISFNQKYAKGELFLEYDNLKIAILDYSGDEIQKEKLTSFFANSFKVNSKKQGGENLKPVEIYYERDEKRSIIHFWWKSIYAGVIKVIAN